MQDKLIAVKRIIFIVQNRFSKRDYQRFGVEFLQDNGFRVEVWELTPILYFDYFQSYAPVDTFVYDGLKVFTDKIKAYDELSGLSNTDFVISFITFRYLSLDVYRALSRSFANYAVAFFNSFPYPIIKRNCLKIVLGTIRDLISLKNKETWKRLFTNLPLCFLGIRPARLMFVGGEKYLIFRHNLRYPIDKNTEFLQTHAFDYDLYLKEKDKPWTEKPIAIFLDEFYPFHPDFIVLKRKSPVSPDNYYKLLNSFFDLVEKETGLEVVIAAHPRSNYENMPDYFKGRKCIKGNSINLVRECKMVLAHGSTSIIFANLFYKPVIFLTCADLDKSYEGDYIKAYAGSFCKTPIFIDKNNKIDWRVELKVDIGHYDNYRRLYIKTQDSEDLPIWQIIANRLKKGGTHARV